MGVGEHRDIVRSFAVQRLHALDHVAVTVELQLGIPVDNHRTPSDSMAMLGIDYDVLVVLAQIRHLACDGTMDVQPVVLELFHAHSVFFLHQSTSADHAIILPESNVRTATNFGAPSASPA